MIGQIGSGTMDYGGQKIGAEHTHGLQKLGRAQMVILKAEADLILVLTQMGMNSGVKFSSIPYHGEQIP